MSKDEKMKLAKSAKDLKEDGNIPTVQAEDEPEIPWEEAKELFTPAPDLIVFRVPKKTKSGIVLPDGRPISAESDEYRPVAEIVGDEVEFVEPGDSMILHGQAEQQAVPLKFKGHKLFLVHQQFVMGKASN